MCMLLLCRFRMNTHLLGIKLTPLGKGLTIRRFERTEEGSLKTPLAIWDWALRETISNLGWRDVVDWSAIRPDPVFNTSQLGIHRRSYYKGEMKKTEDYECVDPGMTVTQPMLLTEAPDNISTRKKVGSRTPTLEEVSVVMECIGRYCGISPWGNRYGYGRFELDGVERVKIASFEKLKELRCLDMGPPKPGVKPEDDELEDDPMTGVTGIFTGE